MRFGPILLLVALSIGAAASAVEPAALSETVKVLASDGFEGRAPGTPGEAKTVEYLIGRFKAMGLSPAGDSGGWTQAVPLRHIQLAAEPRLTVDGPGGQIVLRQGEQIAVRTLHIDPAVQIAGTPMVFVGYGVTAPERGWDDFKGVDLHGKVAVFLVNDPDFEAAPGEPVYGRFGGKAMTYYGRWTYKFEEAARHGAAAALVVHETAAAGYGWSVAAGQGDVYDVVRGPNDPQTVPVEGWIQRDLAVELFRRAGLDFEALKVAARREDFHPVPLKGVSFGATLTVNSSTVESHNVLAKIVGAKRPGEAVMFGAHWDAYGIGEPDASGATIRHGANDDGLGVAGVLEIADAFAKGERPDRTVLFALWTAEERNLLGSETYAAHPLFPLEKVAANLTMDIFETAGPARDVVLVGAGQDSLERDLADAAKTQNRVVTPDPRPEKGLFYRADHFSFAKRGVPTLLIFALSGGYDLENGGREAGNRWVDDYTANCYHKPCDAWSADWDLRGAAQDIDLVYQVGRGLAFSDRWPSWNAGSEFLQIRARSDSQRR